MSKGYVVVASRKNFYYYSALNLISSIKEFDPDAKCCLVAEQQMFDLGGTHFIDDLIVVPPEKSHQRTKLWGMAMSPYDQTFYIDADCEVHHEDIQTIWDKFGDKDILFTGLDDERSYIFAEYYFGPDKNSFDYCGAVCLYNSEVKEFIQAWYELTLLQMGDKWWPKDENGNDDEINYPKTLKRWDQFSLWYLLNRDPKWEHIKHGLIDDDYNCRWNNFHGYQFDHCRGLPPIIYHYSNSGPKRTRC